MSTASCTGKENEQREIPATQDKELNDAPVQ